jgi:hypothetical protein
MKRVFLFSASLIIIGFMTSCGGSGSGSGSGSAKSVKGTTMETSEFSYLLPDGWELTSPNFREPTNPMMYKGDDRIEIRHDSYNMTAPDGSEKISYEIGGKTWAGYIDKSMGSNYYIVTSQFEGDDYKFVVLMTRTGLNVKDFTPKDPVAQAVIGSITLNK